MKKFGIIAFLVLALAFSAGTTVYAQDAPVVDQPAATSPADAPAEAVPAPTPAAPDAAPKADGGKDAGFFANNIEMIVSVLGMIFAALLGLGVFGKYTEKLEKIRDSKSWGIAKTAALDTYHTYARAIKKGREDGKLTEEEAKEARAKTISKMKELAKSEGVKLIKSQLPALSELAVNFLKKKASEAKAGS
ncbi:hypothetical protein LCGC14_0966890 [marine sediment metagenome]|uniref:Uncharacterized protein n=1 Tax=marine sediment metagenome TaxID=412755 RepID=A0A0F9RJD3_9ZZZZ